MTADLIKFVDSIVAVPTVRLDVNDQGATGTTWHTRLDPGPPRLRRAMSSNAMRDGVSVSSSTYDARVLRFSAVLRAASQDALATGLQQLQRELDRETNILMYQPFGATKPVFFETYRSDMSQIRQVPSQVAMQELEFEVLAAPFALGLRETIVVGTVNNDPAAASNGCFFDVTGVIGDVPAPCVIVDTITANTDDRRIVGVRQRGTPSNATYFAQGESLTLGATVTNPGGAADAVMSGTGTTNYVRTAGTSGLPGTDHVTWTLAGSDAARIAQRGAYRLFAVVRLTASNVFTATIFGGATTTIGATATAARRIVDLGLVQVGDTITYPGGRATVAPIADVSIRLDFVRTTGAGNLDLDYLQLVPADECQAAWTATGSAENVMDSPMEGVYTKEAAADLYGGAANIGAMGVLSGGFPVLVPNQTNRFVWIRGIVIAPSGPTEVSIISVTKGNASSLTVNYWPRYVFVRPSAT